jgi:hypothetical protein
MLQPSKNIILANPFIGRLAWVIIREQHKQTQGAILVNTTDHHHMSVTTLNGVGRPYDFMIETFTWVENEHCAINMFCTGVYLNIRFGIDCSNPRTVENAVKEGFAKLLIMPAIK